MRVFGRLLYNKYFKGIKHGTIMECGALDGVNLSNSLWFESIGWDCINIEASPRNYRALVNNRNAPVNHNYNCALMNKCGKVKVHEAACNGRQYPKMDCVRDSGKIEVESITYAKFIEREDIKQINIFVLDVEGKELEVIDGMYGAKVMPEVFMIETATTRPNTLKAIQEALGKLGINYKFDCTLSYNVVYIRQI